MVIKLNILEKNDEKFIEEACKLHYKSKKCKSCKKYKQINNKIGKIYKKNGKINSKTLKLYNKFSNKCDKCSSINAKKCNSKQIKNYSKWYYGK
jgi:hypothetical protein